MPDTGGVEDVGVAVTPAEARAALLAADRAYLTAAVLPPPPRWWIPLTSASPGLAVILGLASPLHTTDDHLVRLVLRLAVLAPVAAFVALYAVRAVAGGRVRPRLPSCTTAERLLRDGPQVAAIVLGGLAFAPLGRTAGAITLGVLWSAATWWRETRVVAGYARLASRLGGPGGRAMRNRTPGPALDALLTDPVRLTALAFLAGCHWAEREAVRDHLAVSDEAADAALTALRDAGHLTVRRSGARVRLSLTPTGHAALTGHLTALRAVADTPDRRRPHP
jgi:DNA-binding transcriptional ArsR family regulator